MQTKHKNRLIQPSNLRFISTIAVIHGIRASGIPQGVAEDQAHMGYSPKKTRSAWEDKFRTPSIADLRQHYNRQLGNLLDTARERFLAFPGVKEELSWQGLPWRWTILYMSPDDPGRPWVYLVPDPEKPKISMPLTTETIGALPMQRLKKHVRDGVLAGRMVAGVHWATWEVTSKAQLQDVMELAESARKFMARRN